MRGVTTDTSLEVNRARLEALFRSDGWVGSLGAELVEWGGGRAVFRLRPEARHVSPGRSMSRSATCREKGSEPTPQRNMSRSRSLGRWVGGVAVSGR